jgi:hypothetical protein
MKGGEVMTGTHETHCPYCGSGNWRIADTDYDEWTHIKIYLADSEDSERGKDNFSLHASFRDLVSSHNYCSSLSYICTDRVVLHVARDEIIIYKNGKNKGRFVGWQSVSGGKKR